MGRAGSGGGGNLVTVGVAGPADAGEAISAYNGQSNSGDILYAQFYPLRPHYPARTPQEVLGEEPSLKALTGGPHLELFPGVEVESGPISSKNK